MTDRLPARPLIAALERMRAPGESTEDLYARAGIDARKLSVWRNQPRAHVNPSTADKVLTRGSFNWWDVWPACGAHPVPDRGCPVCWAYFKARRVFDGERLPKELR